MMVVILRVVVGIKPEISGHSLVRRAQDASGQGKSRRDWNTQ